MVVAPVAVVAAKVAAVKADHAMAIPTIAVLEMELHPTAGRNWNRVSPRTAKIQTPRPRRPIPLDPVVASDRPMDRMVRAPADKMVQAGGRKDSLASRHLVAPVAVDSVALLAVDRVDSVVDPEVAPADSVLLAVVSVLEICWLDPSCNERTATKTAR